jgi:hypothetical protein
MPRTNGTYPCGLHGPWWGFRWISSSSGYCEDCKRSGPGSSAKENGDPPINMVPTGEQRLTGNHLTTTANPASYGARAIHGCWPAMSVSSG